MYISKLTIKNFKKLDNFEVMLNEKRNIFVGPNNIGKTTVIQAIQRLFTSNRQLDFYDFYRNIPEESLRKEPPKMIISAEISKSTNENEHSQDLALFATAISSLNPITAVITLEYFLPEKENPAYYEAVKNKGQKEIWDYIRENCIRKYTYKIYGGDPALKNVLSNDILSSISLQILNPIRDVERDMASGGQRMLREVLEFMAKKEGTTAIADIVCSSNTIIQKLKEQLRSIKEKIQLTAENTGTKIQNFKLDFEGNLSESNLYSLLRLVIVQKLGNIDFTLPLSHNGLGYNNLIYIALLLQKMEVETCSDNYGDNAKNFPILIIEEPEAHLHPSMQYQFLQFLKKKETQIRQIFITTHSPNITASADLDELIILSEERGKIKATSLKNVFENKPKEKKYVEKYLDATRSDMLFAKGVIFVEGISELLLIPFFAKKLGLDLTANHIVIIPVGSRSFKNFLSLFQENGIQKKAAVVTDNDYVKDGKKIYAYEYQEDDQKFSKNPILGQKFTDNIKIFFQTKGRTLEDELVYSNMANSSFLEHYANTDKKLTDIINHSIDQLKGLSEDKNYSQYTDIFKNAPTKEDILAALFLETFSDKKSHIAFHLAVYSGDFDVPTYVKDALEWVLQ